MTELKLLEHPLAYLISQVKNRIRAQPTVAEHRATLAQLLFLSADFEAGLKHYQAAAQLEGTQTAHAQIARLLVIAETMRSAVMVGERPPAVLGQTPDWLWGLINALSADAIQATDLRAEALEAAPANPGSADDFSFDWLMDGDERLGPVFEVIVGGQYHWLPMSAVTEVHMTPPTQPMDLVWAPVRVSTVDGQEHLAFMPARYPVKKNDDEAVLRGHRTEWVEQDDGLWTGAGRRMWFTPGDEMAIYGATCIRFDQVIEGRSTAIESPGPSASEA